MLNYGIGFQFTTMKSEHVKLCNGQYIQNKKERKMWKLNIKKMFCHVINIEEFTM